MSSSPAKLDLDMAGLLRDQLGPHGILNQGSRGIDAEGLHDLVLVRFRGTRRNAQNRRHFFHGAAFGDKLQNLALAGSQGSAAVAASARFHEQRDQVFGQKSSDIGSS